MSSNVDYAHQAPGAEGVNPDHPASARPVIIDATKAVIEVTPSRKKFAICGFAASSRALAPWDDPAYEIWGLNQLYRHIPRADRWFDIHANWREDNVEGTDHPGWLSCCGLPVYMNQIEPSIPTSVRYPIESVIAGVAGTDYFTSTVAFMLGLAIWEIDQQVAREVEVLPISDVQTLADYRLRVAELYGQREIGIFGIDLVVGDEYVKQKQCVEFLLGIAHARGILLRIPPQSALLKQQWRYGYEKEPGAWPIRLMELQRRSASLSNERNQLIARLQTIDGALQENGYWMQVADLRLKGAAVKLNEDT